jgi:hypothetical protein
MNTCKKIFYKILLSNFAMSVLFIFLLKIDSIIKSSLYFMDMIYLNIFIASVLVLNKFFPSIFKLYYIILFIPFYNFLSRLTLKYFPVVDTTLESWANFIKLYI